MLAGHGNPGGIARLATTSIETKQQKTSDSLAAVRCEAHIFGVVFLFLTGTRVESLVTNLMQ